MIDKIKTFVWRWKFLFLFFSLFLILLSQRFLNDKQNGLPNSISLDGLGYYSYLPASIIYQDFTYSYYGKPENKIKQNFWPYITPYKSNGVNKYYCGTAICFLPFFLVGIVISAIAGTDINGYTDTFLMLISIGALIYYLLSIFLISKIGKFFSISEKVSVLVCLIFFFGTNLFHYVIQEPSMSHAYSFFAVSLFLYVYVRLIENVSSKNLWLLGLSLGLVVLIRPVNIVVVLFTPFFFENLVSYFQFLKTIILNHTKGVVLFIAAVISAVFLQFIFYYLQTGDFFIVSYEGESFNFLKPEIYNTLFSYKKGLFIYTPLFLASILFSIFTKNSWFKKIVFFITFLVFLYITSSWWCWWYGGGYSNRPFIDILPLLIVTTLFIIKTVSANTRKIVLIISIPFVMMNQLMAYQYSNLIMHSYEMDKEKFWNIFLETKLASINDKKIALALKNKQIYKTELLNYDNDEGDSRIVDGGYHSKKACVVGEKNFYSKGYVFPLKDLAINESFYLIVECNAKTTHDGRHLGLVVSLFENENCVKWDVVFKSQFEEDEEGWAKMTHIVEIDKELIRDNMVLKIFANNEKSNNLVDDLKYTIVKK